MPNWTDENGYNWFGKIECKRCLQRFDGNSDPAVGGSVPIHRCVGGYFTSKNTTNEFGFTTTNDPIPVSQDLLITWMKGKITKKTKKSKKK
jgi:hypothetical protein